MYTKSDTMPAVPFVPIISKMYTKSDKMPAVPLVPTIFKNLVTKSYLDGWTDRQTE